MSLDLSTLNEGDHIASRAGGQGVVRAIFDGYVVVEPEGDRWRDDPFTLPERYFDAWDVVVLPPPCPITEPVTLYRADGSHWCTQKWRENGPLITLHPPGTVFSDRPSALYTWGET